LNNISDEDYEDNKKSSRSKRVTRQAKKKSADVADHVMLADSEES
jgi:hypothetical protein